MRYGRQNQPIRVPIETLLVDNTGTFLTADTASGSGTLTVKNITGFAINQILLIGDAGNQGSEIIKTHASTAPTGSTITLASNTVFPHSAGTSVTVINFDQIEYSTATTTTGSKSVLATSNIVANALDTFYNDTAASAGYYFARFKNTITTLFSTYSDPSPVGGYTLLSARRIIDSALNEINKTTSSVLTDEYAFLMIDDCQTECLMEQKRWSFMQSFNTIIGTANTGAIHIALPTDCEDQNTNKSVYNFRMGKEFDIAWIDKERWDEILQSVAYNTLAQNIGLGDTSIILTSSADFFDNGTVQIGANEYAYSANDTTTNTLTIDASTTTNTAGEDALQNGSLSLPSYFTVFDDTLWFYPSISQYYNGRNFYLDYYKKQTQIIHDSDNIVLPDPTVVKYYLQWKFLLKLNNGEENSGSSAARDNYLQRREKMKQKESLNRQYIWKPAINNWSVL